MSGEDLPVGRQPPAASRQPVKGRLIVISGPSGVGKTTVCDALLALPGFRRVITATSRSPRPGERDGVDYLFMTEDAFLQAVARGEFIEHARVHGRLYGTPRRQVEQGLREGKLILLNIDVQGARQVREAARGGAALPLTLVFLAPPSWAELERRLSRRGTETPEAVRLRLDTARKEMEERGSYEHVVVNDTLEVAVRDILRVIGRQPPEGPRPARVE